jgi:hypothetical protein
MGGVLHGRTVPTMIEDRARNFVLSRPPLVARPCRGQVEHLLPVHGNKPAVLDDELRLAHGITPGHATAPDLGAPAEAEAPPAGQLARVGDLNPRQVAPGVQDQPRPVA